MTWVVSCPEYKTWLTTLKVKAFSSTPLAVAQENNSAADTNAKTVIA
jgi:hypothetical protein